MLGQNKKLEIRTIKMKVRRITCYLLLSLLITVSASLSDPHQSLVSPLFVLTVSHSTFSLHHQCHKFAYKEKEHPELLIRSLRTSVLDQVSNSQQPTSQMPLRGNYEAGRESL